MIDGLNFTKRWINEEILELRCEVSDRLLRQALILGGILFGIGMLGTWAGQAATAHPSAIQTAEFSVEYHNHGIYWITPMQNAIHKIGLWYLGRYCGMGGGLLMVACHYLRKKIDTNNKAKNV